MICLSYERRNMQKYKIMLSENQLRVIQVALEEYFRLRMGQDFEFCDDMAGLNTDLSPENPNHDKIFDKFLNRRDSLRHVMKAFFNIAFDHGYLENKTDDMLVAEDIWDSIRAARGISRWPSLLNLADEPVPKIELITYKEDAK